MNLYLPILVLAAIAAAFAVGSVGIALVIGPRRYNRAKQEAYECGIEPAQQPTGAGRFPIKFYLTAMLFIVFDIEIVFLYPWAVAFGDLGTFAGGAALLGGTEAMDSTSTDTGPMTQRRRRLRNRPR